MKAISIREPWAGMIASNKKTIETRVWKTKYRGDILIVASLLPRTENSGKAIAVATIKDCKSMIPKDEKEACCKWYPKANSWFLENIRKIKPFKVKGKLGIYDVELPEGYSIPPF